MIGGAVLQSDFSPVFIGRTIHGEVVNGWCIGCNRTGGHIGKEPDTSMPFGNRDDCTRAIRALAEQGITNREHVLARNRSEVVKICCDSLMW